MVIDGQNSAHSRCVDERSLNISLRIQLIRAERRPVGDRRRLRPVDEGCLTQHGEIPKRFFSLEEGAWILTENQRTMEPLPAAGTSVNIRPGAMGSFFCKIEGRVASRCLPSSVRR